MLDRFNREVVGGSLKPRMTADIVTDALTMACFRKRPAAGLGLMHHSDRGSQYASENGRIRRLATSRLFSSWRTGSDSSIRKNGAHEIHPLADEKPWEAHKFQTINERC